MTTSMEGACPRVKYRRHRVRPRTVGQARLKWQSVPPQSAVALERRSDADDTSLYARHRQNQPLASTQRARVRVRVRGLRAHDVDSAVQRASGLIVVAGNGFRLAYPDRRQSIRGQPTPREVVDDRLGTFLRQLEVVRF